MKNKKHKNENEKNFDELTQVHNRLKYMENKLQRLLEKEGKEINSELEKFLETSYEVIVDNHIKEKQKIKNKTKVNKNYLDKIIRECKEGVFLIGKAGDIQGTNGRLEPLLGYKTADFQKIDIKSVFPLADRLESNTKYSDALSPHMALFYERKKQKLAPMETIFLDKKKNAIPFHVKTAFLKDSTDQLMGAIILLKDIRERKGLEYEIKIEKEKLKEILETSKNIEIIERLKEDLEENKIYIKSIIESSTDGIIITDTSGFIKRVNKPFEKLSGYQHHELEGKHWAELNPHETKEYPTNYGDKILLDQSYINGLLDSMSGLFSEGGTYFDAYLIRRDGALVPVGCSLYWIYDRKGERNEGFVIVRDLTEKKLDEMKLKQANIELQEAKEYLENIISTSADGIVITDPQGTIIRVNEAVEKMAGYTQEEMKGMHVSQLSLHAPDETYYQLRANMVDKLFAEGRVTGLESEWKSKKGELVPIELNAALLKDKEGLVVGGVIGIRDIRERKKLEEMKNDFISSISHELRTPLTSVKGSIDNLLDGIAGKLNDDQREYLAIINNESDRLVRLINDLLDLNKLEAGSITLFPEEIEYIALVAQVVFSLKELAHEKGLTLEMEASSKEILFKADRDRINQILINLINNAVKFTERGGIKVVVENPKNQSVTTRVIDTGIGIPQDGLDRVFDKFYQLNKPRTGTSRGSGLGLSITKNLVEMHGGKIWVESEEGTGSEFYFTLPTGV